MVPALPTESFTVSQSTQLRNSLPEGTTAAVIKNTLMTRAIAESDKWESASSLLKGSNMWFFIDSDIKDTLKVVEGFTKENGLDESNAVKGGVIDGSILDPAGVKKVGKLPSKLELITKIAGGINLVPTKLARVTKAPSSKLARAIKLATEDKENKEE